MYLILGLFTVLVKVNVMILYSFLVILVICINLIRIPKKFTYKYGSYTGGGVYSYY